MDIHAETPQPTPNALDKAKFKLGQTVEFRRIGTVTERWCGGSTGTIFYRVEFPVNREKVVSSSQVFAEFELAPGPSESESPASLGGCSNT